MPIISALIITIINTIVQSISYKLSQFSRYKTQSAEDSSIMMCTFMSQYFNMCILPFITSFRFGNFVPTVNIISYSGLKLIATDPSKYFNDLGR